MMPTRLLIVMAILLGLALAHRLWVRHRSARAGRVDPRRADAHLPPALTAGERTWVVFTTPWCTTCGAVEERLRSADPRTRVVRVDATRQPAMARRIGVRSAPTAVLTAADGRVLAHLSGPEAVAGYLARA